MRANGVVYLCDKNPAGGELTLQIAEKAVRLPQPDIKPDLEKYLKEREALVQKNFENNLLRRV